MFYIHVKDRGENHSIRIFGPYGEGEAQEDLLKKGWVDVTTLYGYCPTFVKSFKVNETLHDLLATVRRLEKLPK